MAAIQGAFGSVVHTAPSSNNRIQGTFGAVVHTAPAPRVKTAFTTVVHDAVPEARFLTGFSTVVHDAVPEARFATGFTTIVHTSTGSVGGIIGLIGEDLRPLIGLFASRRKLDN